MAYKPNLNDTRVRSRIRKSLGFVRSCFHGDKTKPWSCRHIGSILGNTSRPLGAWLKYKLLILDSDAYSAEHGNCKSYRLNVSGYQYVKQMLSETACMTDDELADDWVVKSFRRELESKKFKYRDKSHRRWHGLQNVSRDIRTRALKKYGFAQEYDISAAAPTTLYQYVKEFKKSRKKLPFINQLLEEKHSIRERISQELELDITTTKKIIAAMFCGAHITTDPDSAIFELVDGDRSRIDWLKKDIFVQGLKKDIKKVWSVIKADIPARESIDPATGVKKISNRLNARQKWDFYFSQERRIIDVVEKFLRESGIKYFLIHDGWACEFPIDRDELEKRISLESGYNVMIDTK